MRIRVRHDTVYRYAQPASHAIQTLRLTPRGHDGQFVCRWRIDIDADCRLERDEDPYGNITHTFSVDGPIEQMRVTVDGEVATEDMNGFVRGEAERLPLAFYLRETDLTTPDAAIRELAQEISCGEGGDRLGTMHALMSRLHKTVTFDTEATSPATSAAAAFEAKRGVCQDFAQIFIAAARTLGVPARYVAGYLLRDDGVVTQEAGHAWAEAHVPGYGWIGFDPANDLCVTDRYVRVAIASDGMGAAPIRGMRTGGDGEFMTVKVMVEPAQHAPRPIPIMEQSMPGMSQTLSEHGAQQTMLPPR